MATIFCAFLPAGCDRPPEERRYTEIFSDEGRPKTGLAGLGMPDDEIHAGLKMPDAETPLMWETPEGWQAHKGSGMRAATFTSGDQTRPVETTIVSLEGTAGNLSANVIRWMQQINVDIPAREELETFLADQKRFSTRSGLPVLLIDLTERQTEDPPDAAGMIAAIIETDNARIFVKMTGRKKDVHYHRGRFQHLIQSIGIR